MEKPLIAGLFALLVLCPVAQARNDVLAPTPIRLPVGEGGMGFDDLTFSPALRKVLVPGGRSGKLYLIDPITQDVEMISGFSSQATYDGGHDDGITSVDEGNGFIFVTDRTAKTLDIVDAKSRTIVASAPLASNPDYVRTIRSTNEVWVTQPDNDRIEVFTLSSSDKPTAVHSRFIPVEGGPESLIFDRSRQRAYTHLWAGKTVVIDVKKHAIVAAWNNGCRSSRGIALDEKHGFLFAASAEGKVNVLDAEGDGRLLGSLETGPGIDVISYNAARSHLYVTAAKSAKLFVIGVSKEGHLTLLGTGTSAYGSHCATGDDQGNVWVCDPQSGQLLLFKDTLS